MRPQHPGYTRPRWGTSWRVHAGLGGLAGDEESAPSFGHLRILPADLSELGSGLRVDRRRALLCGPCACDGRSERRRSLVRVARPSGWDLANPYTRERMSARTLGIWVVHWVGPRVVGTKPGQSAHFCAVELRAPLTADLAARPCRSRAGRMAGWAGHAAGRPKPRCG